MRLTLRRRGESLLTVRRLTVVLAVVVIACTSQPLPALGAETPTPVATVSMTTALGPAAEPIPSATPAAPAAEPTPSATPAAPAAGTHAPGPPPEVAPTGTAFTMRVPVLMYHRISCAPPDAANPGLWVCPSAFRAQLTRLKNKGWTSVTADALARKFAARERFGRKHFVISIDDGARDGYTAAFPILQDLGMVATFYVSAGRPGCCRTALDWDELREMYAAGQDIANHGMDHDALAGASDLFHEIEMSQRRFERKLGYRPTTFCYAYGSHDADARAQVRASGLILAFTTVPGARESTRAPFESKRIRVSRGESPADVLAKLMPYASGR